MRPWLVFFAPAVGSISLGLIGCRSIAGIDDVDYTVAGAGGSTRVDSEQEQVGGSAGSLFEGAGGRVAQDPPTSTAGTGSSAGEGSGGTGGAAGTAGAPAIGGSAGQPSQAWQPSAIGERLVLWLNGSDGVVVNDGKVESWKDLSGYHNDAQPSLDPAPTYSDRIAPGKHGALVFGGNAEHLRIQDDPSLNWGTDDFLVEVVAAYSNAPSQNEWIGYATLFVKAFPRTPYEGVGLYGNGPNPEGGPILSAVCGTVAASGHVNDPYRSYVTGKSSGINDSRYHILGFRRWKKHNLEARLDGKADNVNSSAYEINVTANAQPLLIGAGYVDTGDKLVLTRRLQGHIAEVIAVHGSFTDQEVETLEAYLKAKYAL